MGHNGVLDVVGFKQGTMKLLMWPSLKREQQIFWCGWFKKWDSGVADVVDFKMGTMELLMWLSLKWNNELLMWLILIGNNGDADVVDFKKGNNGAADLVGYKKGAMELLMWLVMKQEQWSCWCGWLWKGNCGVADVVEDCHNKVHCDVILLTSPQW